MSASTGHVAPANALLAAIDRSAPGMLREQCVEVTLRRGQVLAEPGQPIGSVYFPHDAVISLTISMTAGVMAEAATVGREGMTGYSAAFGERAAFARSIVQVSGTADKLPLDTFAAAFDADRQVRQISLCYTQALLGQILQSVACGTLHTAEQRLARWLLMLQDRAGSDRLNLTQEFLAGMLGVRRATVSATLQGLRRRSIVEQERGVIRIQRRRTLEGVSCECYGIVRAYYDRVLPKIYPAMSATVQTGA
jgi:CRP-like cAMP-binding protein